MRHVESIASVLFKSTWRRGIIKDHVSIGTHYGGALFPPVVSGIGLAERESFSLAALSPGGPSFSFSAHSSRTLRSQSGRLHDDIYQQTFPQQNPISATIQIGSKLRVCLNSTSQRDEMDRHFFIEVIFFVMQHGTCY